MCKRRRLCITKRACIALVLLLVGGAIVNVALAWGLAAYSPFGRYVHQWDNQRPSHHFSAPGFDVVIDAAVSPLETTVSTGWPSKSLHSMNANHVCDGIVVNPMGFSDSHAEVSFLWDPRFLPTNPILPGFAINTVFYAFILWGLFAAPFALRRRRRIKRGLCPKCAYPVGTWGGEVCTECGATR